MCTDEQWAEIRAAYEAGALPSELSGRYPVSAKTIRNRASLNQWKQNRDRFGTIMGQLVPERVAEKIATAAADFVAQHVADTQMLRAVVMAVFSKAPEDVGEDDWKLFAAAVNAIKAYKDLQGLQRASLGLDRPEQTDAEQAPKVIRYPAKRPE